MGFISILSKILLVISAICFISAAYISITQSELKIEKGDCYDAHHNRILDVECELKYWYQPPTVHLFFGLYVITFIIGIMLYGLYE